MTENGTPPILRPGVTEADALAYINAALGRHGFRPLTRGAWGRGIRPLFDQDGAAWKSGGSVLIDPQAVSEWAEYLVKRQVLIQQKVPGWHERRAYSLEDLYALVQARN